MTDEQTELKNALSQLEPDAGGDVQMSIAISLKKISDKLAEAPAKAPPILHRGIK
jgi:hypothetical protein